MSWTKNGADPYTVGLRSNELQPHLSSIICGMETEDIHEKYMKAGSIRWLNSGVVHLPGWHAACRAGRDFETRFNCAHPLTILY